MLHILHMKSSPILD